MNGQVSGQVALCALAAIAGVLISVLLVAAVHYLNPEFDPVTRAMSDYVYGRQGWLMGATLVLFGLSVMALAGAFRHVVSSAFEQTGVILLALAGLCVVTAGIFPTDATVDGGFETVSGGIHAVAGHVLSPLVVIAMLFLSHEPIAAGDHRILQSSAWMLAIVNALAFLALLFVNLVVRWPIGGFGQRVFMALVSGWLILASCWGLLRKCSSQ